MNIKYLAGTLLASLALTGCPDFGGGGDPDAAVDGKLPPDGKEPKNLVCKSGSLFAGNPLYDAEANPAQDGGPLKSDPPLQWRGLAFDGNLVYTTAGEEVWFSDLSAAQPVQKRVAGEWQIQKAAKFVAGACKDARVGITTGVAVLPDHSLVVADLLGNALVKITDPTGANCKLSFLAGNTQAFPGGLPVANAPNPGDADGKGGGAKFLGPKWPVADANGNVYFFDEGNKKVKKLAAGPDATVSTVASLVGAAITDTSGMVLRGDKLYLADNDSSNGIVVEVDPADGKVKTLLKAGGSVFDVADAPVVQAIATDGTRLFVSAKDQIFLVNDDNTVTLAAGAPRELEFPQGYDPTADHPASELVLRSPIGRVASARANNFLTYQGDSLYYTGGLDNGFYVEKITCPKP